jgi:carbon-monoxide dehydrogenase small subunit
VSVHKIQFELNGETQSFEVPANRLLIEVLRDDCKSTGTKEGCSLGVCGACGVLVDGELVSSCLFPAVFVDGKSVETVEGLSHNGDLSALQDAFIRRAGLQCGICTPGQLISATALLKENPKPTVAEIREWMMGNLCRCTGYYQIVDSILEASGQAPQ